MVIERWIYDENRNLFKLLKLPTLIGYLILRKIKNMVYVVGMGRHSKEEVYHILEEDFKAVSNYLGTLLSTFVLFCRSLFVLCPFSFGHCVVFSSSIYRF